jgi:hypothetical protein
MVLGFNHNVQYKGEIFHIQTEDSGVDSPHITTLLYRGGTIVSSKKTSYADILRMDNLEKVVEELMKEQHKEMLRRLKAGEFDEKAFGQPSAVPGSTPPDSEAQTDFLPGPAQEPASPPAEEIANRHKSLDEIILDYLVAGESEERQ